MDFDFKNGCKEEFQDDNENHTADSEKGFLAKLTLESYGRTWPCRQRDSFNNNNNKKNV